MLERNGLKFIGFEKYPEIASFDNSIFTIIDSFDIPEKEYFVFPGFCDVHVHFRQPGFSYKETIKSGSLAAAHGGYTAVCTMPNLSPVPDSVEHLECQLDAIRRDAVINVYPYGAITVAEQGESLSDMSGMAENVVAFSDDGKGVQSEVMMRCAMEKAKSLGKLIAAHCEVNSLLNGGYIHDGKWARENGHRGICSESEWRQIERDVKLAAETGCSYHVCHISCKESVSIIRDAKRNGVDVTCETAPHYLVLDENDLIDEGRFKMNPPLRSREDREALIEGVLDGTVDMIATDHAPHSVEEKSCGLEKSAFGITGIETAFPVLYTHLVKTGIIPLERVIEMLTEAPRKRFGIRMGKDFSIWSLDECEKLMQENLISLGKSTPFEGEELFGVCKLCVCDEKTVWKK